MDQGDGTCFVPLTQGKHSILDADDARLIVRPWFAAHIEKLWYAHSNVNGKTKKLHRVILGLTDTSIDIDHEDGDGLNNRRSNLRVCTHAQNMANRSKNALSSSKYKGVCNRDGRWTAQIQVAGIKQYLGSFDSEEDAARAYNYAALRLSGKFARINNELEAFNG